jgi:hypothetical protein
VELAVSQAFAQRLTGQQVVFQVWLLLQALGLQAWLLLVQQEQPAWLLQQGELVLQV